MKERLSREVIALRAAREFPDGAVVNLGGGILFPFEHNDLVVDLRYNLGLVDVSTGVGSSTVKTNGIQIFVGYNFLKL